MDLILHSQQLLYTVRLADKPINQYIKALQQTTLPLLQKTLNTDEKKKAFWLNIYNAFIQISLHQNATLYQNKKHFFTQKFIEIAGNTISLDTIEHGILRRSKIKKSQGYLSKIFPSFFEKKLRVAILDNRIHWALNCGAISCPPIAFYDPQKIEQQLALAEKSYLENVCQYNAISNVVQIPKIFWWFAHDFGGKKGSIQILKKIGIVPPFTKPQIAYQPYNWQLHLNNFSTIIQ